jgi:hypothetical protein
MIIKTATTAGEMGRQKYIQMKYREYERQQTEQ